MGSQVTRDVLIVDNNKYFREGLKLLIESSGYHASFVADGREALETLKVGPLPGLILLDLMMPVMDGWKSLKAIAADASLSAVPVIVMSAGATPSDAPAGVAF